MNLRDEDYLRYIYELTAAYGSAHTSRLAKVLNLNQSSVVSALERLMGKGYIIYEKRQQISFTERGFMEALKVVRKHELAEVLLTKILGLGWEECDNESMIIEHGITDKIAEAIERITSDKRCPHGNPIPAKDLSVEKPPEQRMSSVTGTYRIFSIIFEDLYILKFLDAEDLYPGVDILVKSQDREFTLIEKKNKNKNIVVPRYISEVISVEPVA